MNRIAGILALRRLTPAKEPGAPGCSVPGRPFDTAALEAELQAMDERVRRAMRDLGDDPADMAFCGPQGRLLAVLARSCEKNGESR